MITYNLEASRLGFVDTDPKNRYMFADVATERADGNIGVFWKKMISGLSGVSLTVQCGLFLDEDENNQGIPISPIVQDNEPIIELFISSDGFGSALDSISNWRKYEAMTHKFKTPNVPYGWTQEHWASAWIGVRLLFNSVNTGSFICELTVK